MSLTDIYVQDKVTGEVHRVGDNQHDMLTVDDYGQLKYTNLQNGEGCSTDTPSNFAWQDGYEFVPNEDYYGYNINPMIEPKAAGNGSKSHEETHNATGRGFISRPASQRRYVKIYQDFLECELLTSDEKLLFIVLKSFLDYDVLIEKDGRSEGQVYPSQTTIAEMLGWSRQKVSRVSASLEKKRIIRVVRRAKNMTVAYAIADYEEMWMAKSIEEMQEVARRVRGEAEE